MASPEERAKNAAKVRKWRAANKERHAETRKAWRDRNPEKLKGYASKYDETHPGARNASCREWYDRNVDRERKRCLDNRNKDILHRRDYSKAYNAANKPKMAAIARNRRARQRAGGTHTEAEVMEIFAAQRGKCGYCRVKLGEIYHVDHIIALARGGTNDRRNLQILCVPCNKSKSARDPIDFAQSRGMLL